MKVKFSLRIGINKSYQEEIVEIPDDWTEEEIAVAFNYWQNNYLDGYWYKMEDDYEQ